MIYFSNAKINLGLKIVGRREDGYHELRSLFVPIGWCDVLEVHVIEDEKPGEIDLKIEGVEVEGDLASNLVVKAYELLSEDYKLPKMEVTLLKRIPTGAGLGGGSSNGSFMLKAINELCQLGLSEDSLEEYAGRLGSDCPFFIRNTASKVEGRGEIFKDAQKNLEALRDKKIIVIHPGVGVSTANAFQLLSESGNIGECEFDYSDLSTLTNDFEGPISDKVPEIKEVIEFLKSLGGAYTQMTGSGSAVFSLFDSTKLQGGEFEAVEKRVAEEVQNKGWSYYSGNII